jgi:mRNA interferase HicA
MKYSEFKTFLAGKGATFKEGAKHTKVYLNGKQTTLPRHSSKEIPEGTRLGIMKVLGM